MRGRLLLVLFALVSAGCGEDERLRIGSEAQVDVTTRADGRIDLHASSGVALRGGWAEVQVRQDGALSSLRTRDCAGQWQALGSPPSGAAYFAAARGAHFTCQKDGLGLDWRVWVDPAHASVIASLHVDNLGASELTALRLTPLISEGADAGLFVGQNPDRLRILDNGSDVAADVDAKLHYADDKRNGVVLAILPIESRGNVVSNWSHAIVDLDSHASWIAGALSVDRSIPTLGTRYESDEAPHQGSRAGLELEADNALDFNGKLLPAGQGVDSETMYFAANAPDAFTGLETYADAIAAWDGITVWTKRDGGRRVPNGWNSWSGSSSTGGLGHDIDEQMMSENLDVMAREFEPFGIDYFQVDDGYQKAYGDWFPDPTRFPAGMSEWASRVESKGLRPGLWIGAFSVDPGSDFAKQHPDWLARPEDDATSGLAGHNTVVDLSNPEVVAWIGDTMKRYRDDWRMRWIKLDFAYQAFQYLPRHAPELTSVEVYKRATEKVRDTLGPDVFYLGIALMGVNYGVVDGMRVTLDNGPVWEEPDPFALLGNPQNFKGTIKNGARRYFLTDRVWVTHNDLLFFRTNIEHPDPPVTLDDATTLASFMGLSGSIIKFGEDLRKLTPEQIQIWRKLLPIYPATARPLDLFTRMYPEQWLLHVDGTLPGAKAEWWVLGLLNWGRNYDYENDQTPAPMADAARSYDVDLSSVGLDPSREYLASEFWTEKFLGVVKGKLSTDVSAHGHAVIALRPVTGHPQFLGDNRQFTQGATDLVDETWDDSNRKLSLTFDVDQGAADAVPFEYRFRVYVPDGYSLTSSDVGSGKVSQDGSVITVALTPKAATRLTLSLGFAG
jgi:hypothetical protein